MSSAWIYRCRTADDRHEFAIFDREVHPVERVETSPPFYRA
jgi:hypothetical protein